MSAEYDVGFFKDEAGNSPQTCGVVSIYESLGTREILLHLCETLARKFEGDLDFKFDWWRFKYLADPELAIEAAAVATRADLILLAPESSDLPWHVQMWFGDWLPHRDAGGGALFVVQSELKKSSRAFQWPSTLRHLARQARLECHRLNSSRAGRTTTFSGAMPLTQLEMDELFSEENRTSHWGINE